jgi:hypothetical protein
LEPHTVLFQKRVELEIVVAEGGHGQASHFLKFDYSDRDFPKILKTFGKISNQNSALQKLNCFKP